MSRVTDLIPHRAPWLLVDRVISVDAEKVEAEKRLSQGDPLVGESLGEMLVVEALAQTAACLEGSERGAHRGMLVAASGFQFARRPRAGETLSLSAERLAKMGALAKVRARARIGEELITEGEMTFAVETSP